MEKCKTVEQLNITYHWQKALQIFNLETKLRLLCIKHRFALQYSINTDQFGSFFNRFESPMTINRSFGRVNITLNR